MLTMRALEAGFRCFFTSPEAGNQYGFAQAIRESGIPREQLYIAGSVLSDDGFGYKAARSLTTQRCEESLRTLSAGGLDAPLDMLMLERAGVDDASIRGQWKAVEEARSRGVCRSTGVCNFDLPQLDVLLKSAKTCKPQMAQLQYTLAIRLPHAELREAHARRGVRLMAFSPLGGPDAQIPRATLDECAAIGKRYGKSRYQVALRWLVQQGVAYSIHSRDAAHLREDLDAFSFALTEEEMSRLEALSESAPAYY